MLQTARGPRPSKVNEEQTHWTTLFRATTTHVNRPRTLKYVVTTSHRRDTRKEYHPHFPFVLLRACRGVRCIPYHTPTAGSSASSRRAPHSSEVRFSSASLSRWLTFSRRYKRTCYCSRAQCKPSPNFIGALRPRRRHVVLCQGKNDDVTS